MTDLEKNRLRSDLVMAEAEVARLVRISDGVDPDTVIPDMRESIGRAVKRLTNTLKLLEDS